jgi:hypothetical protein
MIQVAATREEIGATFLMPTMVILDCTMVVALGLERVL